MEAHKEERKGPVQERRTDGGVRREAFVGLPELCAER